MSFNSQQPDARDLLDEFDDSDSLPPFVLPTVASECASSMAVDRPVRPLVEAASAAELQAIGDYELLRELGRGGMGVVYEARDVRLNRRVALKVLPPSAVLDPKRISRFQLEAQAVARLSHPHIVQVFDVGSSRGTHYLAMQLIDGTSLCSVLPTERGLPVSQSEPSSVSRHALASGSEIQTTLEPDASAFRLIGQRDTTCVPSNLRKVARWGRQAAEALDHAHKMGVVHRDVKPSNMIVDAHGDLWLTDFGLAQIADSPSVTMTGDLMGTLRYLSPEQAMARRIPVDHRTDIYSLGVTLYELLAGEPVFPETDRAELLRRIIFESPRPLRHLRQDVPPPLQTVVHKAIEKNPADRYATAHELADDLQRFLDDEPIHAKPPSWLEHAARWSRRNRQLVAAGVLLLLLAAAVGWLMAGRLKVERDAVAKARDEVTQSERKARHNEWQSLVSQIGLTRRTDRAGRRDDAFKLIDRAVELGRDLPLDESNKRLLRNEVIACLALQDDLSLIQRNTHDSGRVHLDFSPRGDRYARTGVEAGIEIHDASGRLEFTLPPPFDGQGTSSYSIFSPAGRWLMVQHLASGRDQIAVWDLTSREIAFRVPMEPGLPYSDFSHDGRQVITFVDAAHLAPGSSLAPGSAGEVRMIDLDSREQVRSFPLPFVPLNTIAGPQPNQVTFLNAADPQTEFSIWDIGTGQHVSAFALPDARTSAAWSRGGRWLAAGHPSSGVIVWDALQQRVTPIRREQVRMFGFSPDDRLIAIESTLEETEFWDLHKAQLVTTSVGRFSRFLDPRPTNNAANEVALYDSRSVSRYRIHRGDEFRRIDLPLPKGDLISQIEFSPDGHTLAAASSSGVTMIDLATGQRRQQHATNCYSAVFGMHQQQPALFCGTSTGIERLPYESDSQQLGPLTMLHSGAFRSAQRYLAATPNGRTVAAIIDHQQVRVWHNTSSGDTTSNESVVNIPTDVPISFLALSPDGTRVATSMFHGAGVRLWDSHTGKLQRDLWPEAISAQATFSPDGRSLLIAESRSFRLMDVASEKTLWEQSRTDASDAPGAYAICPTGQFFAVTPANHEIHLFDRKTLQELAVVAPTNRATTGPLKFSPDGQYLLHATGQTVEQWDLKLVRQKLQQCDLDWP